MNSNELREKFLKFFEKRKHEIVPSSSLIPADPTVLFTTAGMQQFKPYYLGEKPPFGQNVVSCQKCFRTSDIDQVGDEKHLTFFEMLGNFSFGGYFKKETINFAIEFLFKELNIPFKNVIFTIFGGDEKTPFDKESFEILKSLKVPKEKIRLSKREENFWGPTGKEGPCGPTVEVNVNGIEVWNLVFNEYFQAENGNLTPLKQKGVDTGMGLERLAMIINNKKTVFETDFFLPVILKIQNLLTKKEPSTFEKLFKPSIALEKTFENLKYQRYFRIIADHAKASVFLISEGILPSNVERGYILRRVLRRAIRYGKLLNLPKNFLIPVAREVIEIYSSVYQELKRKEADILTVIQNEEEKFEKALILGDKKIKAAIEVDLHDIVNWWNNVWKAKQLKPGEKVQYINIEQVAKELGKKFFDLYQTYSVSIEYSLEEIKNYLGDDLSDIESFILKSFEEEKEKHRKISRAGVEKKFGGVGKEATFEATKLHTATHLLQAALRQILGDHVKQMGSDIIPQRLRFDFSHPQKMTPEEIKKVEDLVNQKIRDDLEVKKEAMRYEEAIKSGALAFFKEKYPPIVTVYSVNNFSREICAGPHVERTSELGYLKIVKEESAGSGIRRIRAVLE